MRLDQAKIVVIVLALGGLAFIAAVASFMFVPAWKDVHLLSAQISGAYAELDAQYANRKNLLSSIGKAEGARADAAKLAPQFLPPGRELDFITSVEDIAARRGVEERITLAPLDGGTAPELKTAFDITLNGDVRAVLQALVDIERMPILLIVDSVTARPTAGAPGAASFLSLNLRGSIPNPPPGI